MIATKKLLSVLFTGALAASASAADYYVASDGTYEGAPEGATVYTTITSENRIFRKSQKTYVQEKTPTKTPLRNPAVICQATNTSANLYG